MPTRRALVVGAGVAGLATALRLRRSDWEIVLIERDSTSQSSGFPFVFRGIGRDAAARLGLLPRLAALSQPRCDTVLIDAAGTPFAMRPSPSVLFPVLHRDDVLMALREAIDDVEVHRRTEVLGLALDDCGVTVTFTDGREDWFDLVVGADGADSRVRAAACGEQYRRRQGITMVSSMVKRTSAEAACMEFAGRSVRLHPLHGGESAVLFAWRGHAASPLRRTFGDLRWLVPDLLSQVDDGLAARRTMFQVYADHWASRQIALIGDAAWSLGLHCEHGASLAIGGAELLGDALDIFTDTAEALVWWENQMRPILRHVRGSGAVLSSSPFERGKAGAKRGWRHPIG